MIQPAREIIYGVCDKTGNCDSYFGFFKSYEDAQKEVKVQSDRLKEDLGLMDLEVKEDRSVRLLDNRKEEIVIIIHPFVLR
jgi:hypothetical protein